MLTDMLLARFETFRDHILVSVTSGARLQTNQAQLADLSNQIYEAFKKNMASGSVGQVAFTIERITLASAIKNDEDAARVLLPYWSDGAHFAISSNQEHTLILKCQGVERDEVLSAIYEELKGAADQFSKTRPALIACFLEELDDSAWVRLAEKSGLQVMTHKLFDNSERSHVSLVVYSSDQTPPKEDGGNTEFYSTTLSFRNSLAKFPLDLSFLRGEKSRAS